MAVRTAVEYTLADQRIELSETKVHQLTLEAMHRYAALFVPQQVPRAGQHRAAETIADRFRRTDLRGKLDVGYGI